jgi:hypothetical protein
MPLDQTNAFFGISVAGAGDVNGDGYADVIVGADLADNGESYEGMAFVYLGGASGGTPPGPSWTADGDQGSAYFGGSVSGAGDVNGDGYADVIVGARNYDAPENGEGQAFVYLGSASGLATTPASILDMPLDQADAWFGNSVAGAGDVNGDGYADVIVGACYGSNGQSSEGLAYLYHGNDGAGLSLRPQQRRSDDAAPIVPGLRSHTPGAFRLAVLGRSPFGRGPVQLEWEVKPSNRFFDGTGTARSAEWTDSGTAGAALGEPVSGLEPGDYHWRARLLYRPSSSLFAQASRWFTVPWNGWHETDLVLASFVGGVVWEDRDRDGIRDAAEPRVGGIAVYLLDSGGTALDLADTDSQGSYRFEVSDSATYKLRFAAPTGYRLTLPDQGVDDTLDSDANRLTGETALITPPHQLVDGTAWSAGMVQDGPCYAPDEPVYIYAVRHDGNNWPILDLQDPNQPDQVTGYNVYRSPSPGAPWPWPLIGSNVVDMDAATANVQWVDQSGDSGSFYYQVSAYNAACDAEGPR